MFCTALTNKEAVFGGREKLEQCLFDICRVCRPEYIIVACGCVPGVIGDDVGMVCDVVRAKTGVPILLLPGAGFMVPDLIDMTLAATELLFKEFTYPLLKNGLKKQNTAVIIGLNLYYVPHNIFKEIQEFFSISGIDKFYCPPVGETKKDYKAISSVSLAVSLCIGVVKKEKGKQLAEKFANFMGVSLIDLNKVFSPSELRDAFLQMGKVLGCELSIAKHLRYWECFYEKKVREAIAAFHGVSCVIATLAFSQSIQFSDLICFLESLGIEVKGFYMLSPVQEMQRKNIRLLLMNFIPIRDIMIQKLIWELEISLLR